MRLRTRSCLIAAASFFSVSAAYGATVDESRSLGTAALKWETRQSILGPTTQAIGGSSLNVVLHVNLDPLKDPTKPLLLVDMPKGAVVEALWSDDKNIDLVVTDGGNKTGTFKVEHTLAPYVTLNYSVFGFSGSIPYNAEDLIAQIPGSNWTYVGLGTSTFDPWGFTAASTKVTAPLLANAQLFSIPLQNLIGDDLQGNIAINATTDPTFEYQTTEVTLNGSATKLDGTNRTFRIPTTDADYLDVPVLAKGAIKYSGVLKTRPSVTITKIGSFTIPIPGGLVLDMGGLVSVDTDYASTARGILVEFPPTTVHVPLPNVKAQKSLDFGNVEVGKSSSLKADMKNTGEMQATLTFKSSDPQFFVVSGSQIAGAKGSYALDVKFTPASDGPASAEITVESNDPNEPKQVLKVTGNGARIDTGDGNGEEGFGPKGPLDSGCGCRTAPAPVNVAGLGAFGLALAAALVRRRRSR
jgi:MYXO-CTERM domain-containing protein